MLGLIFVVKANLSSKFTLTNWNSRFALQVLFFPTDSNPAFIGYLHQFMYLFIYFLSLSDTISTESKNLLEFDKEKSRWRRFGNRFFRLQEEANTQNVFLYIQKIIVFHVVLISLKVEPKFHIRCLTGFWIRRQIKTKVHLRQSIHEWTN